MSLVVDVRFLPGFEIVPLRIDAERVAVVLEVDRFAVNIDGSRWSGEVGAKFDRCLSGIELHHVVGEQCTLHAHPILSRTGPSSCVTIPRREATERLRHSVSQARAESIDCLLYGAALGLVLRSS